jgi:hypothetical protein
MTAAQTLTEKRDVQVHIAPEILSSSTYRGGLGSKWARTNALIRIPSQGASERERLNVQIFRSVAWQLDWFSIHVAEYFSLYMPAEETTSSRMGTGIPIAPVEAYGVTQVWLQLAVSRFLAWLYWACAYRYVRALVRCCYKPTQATASESCYF